MLAIDSSPQIANSVFHIARTFLAFAVFLGAVATSRWGIRRFISDRGRTSHRSSKFYASVFVVAIVSLLLLRGLVEKLGISIGSAISASRFSQGLGWLVTIFLGFYHVLILTAIFLLAIQGIGLAHSFADKRVEAWQGRLRESIKSGETNPRFHAGRILRLANRIVPERPGDCPTFALLRNRILCLSSHQGNFGSSSRDSRSATGRCRQSRGELSPQAAICS
jgi:hypothetical protein